MKKLILLVLCMFMCGCGTTFEQRKQVYLAIYKEAKGIIVTVGVPAAKLYLQSQVNDGQIDYEAAAEMLDELKVERSRELNKVPVK